MEKVKLSAGYTAYEDLNKDSNKVAVFLHGGTIPSWCYDHVFASHKDKGFRLIRYDMYGRGESDGPKAKYDRSFYLKQFEEFLSEVGINEIDTLVGASFGASVATLFAVKNPEKVKKIVYISPALNWMKNTPIAKIFSIPLVGKPFFYKVGKKLIKKRALGFLDTLKGESSSRYKELINTQFADSSNAFWDSLFSQLTGDALRSYHDEYQKLGSLNLHKVFLIWGVGDKEVSQENVNDLKRYFKGLEVEDIKGSGHGLMAEFPGIVSDFAGKALQS